MPTTVQDQGEVLATTRNNTGTASSTNQELNTQGAMLAAFSLPLNSEVVRLGNSYVGGSTTAVAPVAAMPTTAAQLALWNGEATGGKAYVIHRIGFTGAVSAGAAIIQQLLVHVRTVASTVITGTAALGPKSLSGRVSTSAATVLSGVTLGANDGLWHPAGSSVNAGAATATVGLGTDFDCNGLYVIPPGGTFSLAVLCSAAASQTNQLFVTWSEVNIALG